MEEEFENVAQAREFVYALEKHLSDPRLINLCTKVDQSFGRFCGARLMHVQGSLQLLISELEKEAFEE